MSSNADDTDKSSGIEKCTVANFDTWIEYVKDYILALDHDDAIGIWDAYMWQPDPANPGNDPAGFDYQQAGNANQKKLRMLHNKTFAFCRKNLSPAMFEVTRGIETSVPLLLRKLRDQCNDGGPIDRAVLRAEYSAIKLEDYDNMQLYISGFDNLVTKMKYHKIKQVEDDEDVLFQFNMGVPQAYENAKMIASAQNFNLAATQKYYLKRAKEGHLNHSLEL